MSDKAASPELNKPIRSNREAATDITADQQRAEIERARRLNDHGTAFCRQVLDGAFERVYSDDGVLIARRDMQGNLYDLDGNPILIRGEVE